MNADTCAVCGIPEPAPPASLNGWLEKRKGEQVTLYCPRCVPREEIETILAITPMPTKRELAAWREEAHDAT